MAFMQKETYNGAYWEIETTQGTWFLPADVEDPEWYSNANGEQFSEPEEEEEEGEVGIWADAAAALRTYTEGGEILHLTRHDAGTLYRLSAPGYLDCTDWSTEEPEEEEDDA